MNTMNAIEQLKETSRGLTAKIDSLLKENDSLFAEHASLTATANEMLKQILKDSSFEYLNDTMNSLYQRSEKIMADIHRNNVLVNEYQCICRYINQTIEALENNPALLVYFLNVLINRLKELKEENLSYCSSDSLSFTIFSLNDEIRMFCFYLEDIISSHSHFDSFSQRN